MELRVRLADINPHITCSICHGYLIDATTVTECLHTFCKSCLVKHLEENNNCPACNIVIHQSHPLQYISYDRTLQDVVYKLVPNLQEREIDCEKRFYLERSLPWPKENMEKALKNGPHMLNGDNLENFNYHRDDEQVGIELVTGQENLKQIKSRFLRCSTAVTIGHVKKFLAYRLMNSAERHREIDVFLNGEMLGKDHNLKFVLVTRWRIKGRGPLRLYYKKIQPPSPPS